MSRSSKKPIFLPDIRLLIPVLEVSSFLDPVAQEGKQKILDSHSENTMSTILRNLVSQIPSVIDRKPNSKDTLTMTGSIQNQCKLFKISRHSNRKRVFSCQNLDRY